MTLTELQSEREAEFDKTFLETMYQDDGYSEERAVLKAFLRASIVEAYRLGRESVLEETKAALLKNIEEALAEQV